MADEKEEKDPLDYKISDILKQLQDDQFYFAMVGGHEDGEPASAAVLVAHGSIAEIVKETFVELHKRYGVEQGRELE